MTTGKGDKILKVASAGDIDIGQPNRCGEASALVLASHSLELTKRWCNKGLWHDRGRVRMGANRRCRRGIPEVCFCKIDCRLMLEQPQFVAPVKNHLTCQIS